MLSTSRNVNTMKTLVLQEPGSLAVKQTQVPEPGPNDVLVRVESATTCGTDLKAFLRGHPQIPMPGPLGHEYSGVVVSAGPGTGFSAGDAVMGVHSAPCGACMMCLAGQDNLCDSIMETKVLGAYAEYLVIPERIATKNLYAKPDDLSFNRAALLEPLSCVAHGLHMISARVTDRVLVIGPGAIGLMFVAALRAIGVVDVTLLGRNRQRMETGEAMGGRPVLADDHRSIPTRGYDVVIECTGKVDVWESSIDYVRRGGKLVLFGGCPTGTKVSFDTARVHYDQISILSPFHFGLSAVRQARQWILDKAIPLDLLITAERSLEDARRVFADLQAGIGIKYAFKP